MSGHAHQPSANVDMIEHRLDSYGLTRDDAEAVLTSTDAYDLRSGLLELLSHGRVNADCAKRTHEHIKNILQRNPIDRSLVNPKINTLDTTPSATSSHDKPRCITTNLQNENQTTMANLQLISPTSGISSNIHSVDQEEATSAQPNTISSTPLHITNTSNTVTNQRAYVNACNNVSDHIDAPVSQIIHRGWDALRRNRLLVIRHVYLHHRESIITGLLKKWRRMRTVFLQHDALLPVLETSVSHLDESMTKFVAEQIVWLKYRALEQASRVASMSLSPTKTDPKSSVVTASFTDRRNTVTETHPTSSSISTANTNTETASSTQLYLTAKQIERLEHCFRSTPTCSKLKKKRLAETTSLCLSDIDLWFHRRRATAGVDTMYQLSIPKPNTLQQNTASSVIPVNASGIVDAFTNNALNDGWISSSGSSTTSTMGINQTTGFMNGFPSMDTQSSMNQLTNLINLAGMYPFLALTDLDMIDTNMIMTNNSEMTTTFGHGLDGLNGISVMPDTFMSSLSMPLTHLDVSALSTDIQHAWISSSLPLSNTTESLSTTHSSAYASGLTQSITTSTMFDGSMDSLLPQLWQTWT